MEKLIDLLNECWKEKYPKSKLRYYKYDSLNNDFISNWVLNDSEEKVLGKRYWFIERLVKNDKIDFRKVIEKEIEIWFKLMRIKDYPKKIKEEDVEEILMVLSIQDEPIEFLVSILK